MARSARLLIPLVVLLLPVRAAAQTVRGVVTDEASDRPLAGVWIEVHDQVGAQVGAGLSRADGSFDVGASGGASLVASHIGYGDARVSLDRLQPADTLFLDIALAVRPISLQGLEVVGEERCGGERFRVASAARIWADARQALKVAEWTVDEALFRYRVERYVRRLDANAFQVISEERTERPGWGVRPFRSPDGADLAEHGYVRTVEGETIYHAPDVEVLLSDAFLRTLHGGCRHERACGWAWRFARLPTTGIRTSWASSGWTLRADVSARWTSAT